MSTQTKENQNNLTIEDIKNILKEGNERFVTKTMIQRDLNQQVIETSTGQFPYAIVLSCIDSRVPAEIVFDQGIGDIFSARVAGNIINEDVLGSMEYACKVAGSKLIVVMGHTKCGAVTAACQSVKLGNITPLLEKIQPAVDQVKRGNHDMTSEEIERVSAVNVKMVVAQVREKSQILSEMYDAQDIDIVGVI